MPSEKQILKLIANYRSGAKRLNSALAGLSPKALDYRPFSGAWTIREHAVHLADMEASAYLRWKLIIAEPGKTLLVLDENKWTANLDYSKENILDTAALFSLLRKITAQSLAKRAGQKEIWESRFALHPESGPMNLERWLKGYTDHADIHLKYIGRNLSLWKKQKAKKKK